MITFAKREHKDRMRKSTNFDSQSFEKFMNKNYTKTVKIKKHFLK